MKTFSRLALGLMTAILLGLSPVLAQKYTLHVEPESFSMTIGSTAQLNVTVRDANGQEVEVEDLLVRSRNRRAVGLAADGTVTAYKAGSYHIIILLPAENANEQPIRMNVPVEVAFPPLDRIVVEKGPARLYTGTSVRYELTAFDTHDIARADTDISMVSSNPAVASVDQFHNVMAHTAGTTTLTMTADNVRHTQTVTVMENPVAQLTMNVSQQEARTGDVVKFDVTAYNASGDVVDDAPVFYSFHARPDDDLGPPASGQIKQDGRFVAETPGQYTIVAQSGTQAINLTLKVAPRDVAGTIELLGHGPVLDVHTSDLWVWEGVDGRDYAITGTWGANGDTYFWDVTDPANIVAIDTFHVDARTVNDVKVSEDGKTCIISREGASDRKNGIVILDCTNPRDVTLLAEYKDELTGGVHNLFIYENHVYAVNNGRRYDIINIDDPTNPHRVSRFELSTPGHSIHDVWIKDGIAYSSNWGDGLQLVDIGSGTPTGAMKSSDVAPIPEIRDGLAGGSPENPVKIGEYQYPSGRNHAAFPFHSESTGKFFVIAGDEAFPYGLYRTERPTIAAGWLHFVDFTDLDNPEEIARYEVPEAGSHNYWVEDDILYAAFYNGGLRVVDISGELMGDLYNQGREIGWFIPTHHESIVPNAPMVWGPMPHKGTIFFSDWNSGLWAVRVVPRDGSAGTRD